MEYVLLSQIKALQTLNLNVLLNRMTEVRSPIAVSPELKYYPACRRLSITNY